VAAKAYSYPLHQFGFASDDSLDLSRVVNAVLGLQVRQNLTPDTDRELVSLIALALQGVEYGSPAYSGLYIPRPPEIEDLAYTMAHEPYIPVESSPLSGTSIADLVRGISLTGFATAGELYALTHHDTVLVVATPVVAVVIGAAVGAGEGLRTRMARFVDQHQPKPPRKKP
jgi:hypothetical protein